MPNQTISRRVCPTGRRLILILCASLLSFAAAQAQIVTAPTEGLRDAAPRVHAFVNARLVVAPGRVIERGCLVVRDGLIVNVGADLQPPADARVWDLQGKTVYAGFVDCYSHYGLPEKYRPRPLRPEKPGASPPRAAGGEEGPEAFGAGAWNPLVTPQRDAAKLYAADEKAAETLRALGFTNASIVPGRGVFRGSSALVDLNGKNGSRSLVEASATLQSVAFEQSRYREQQYPASLMGSIALIRQTFLDADWHRRAQAFDAEHPGSRAERPEANEALAALHSAAQGQTPVVFETDDELDLLRALRVAEELRLKPILRGNGYEYRVLDALKKAAIPVILPLDFPEAPEVETPKKALDVSLDELEHWNEAPADAGRLAKAGISFALTLDKLDKPEKQFWPRVREAVKRGLSEADALAALTTQPARILGVEARRGTLESGKAANFIVASGNLFADEDAEVLAAWINGERYETEKGRETALAGTYAIVYATPGIRGPGTLKIEGEPAKPKATFGAESINASVQGELLALLAPAKLFGGGEGIARLTIPAEGLAAGSTFEGSGQMPDGTVFRWNAARTADPAATLKKKDDNPLAEKEIAIPPAYPAGAFGRKPDTAAETPEIVLVQNATIWTSGPEGKLENADLLVEYGKISQVGQGLIAPAGARIIDAAGQHVTPGLIDCHSHTAISGGVNEATHAVTCEVRIGDVLDATDISIYRELAGGLTVANILHGSANPIGGQNQPIKLRWGALPEELKLAGTMPGVKFALGENVKQSNWGDRYTTRYPQTRMGVEELLRDTFLAARDYERTWLDYKKKAPSEAMPPRRDLRLEAALEILNKARIVHIHSYRQDELLMFIRLSQEMGFTVGTFQHVLEGYKVADEIAKLGAGASTFSDWWGYKMEAIDAIPQNGPMLQKQGVSVSYNSDSNELARRLNTEAAKAVKYGGLSEEEALKFVTINPAQQLRIDRQTGSLEPGKDADFVIWNGPPLSTYTRAEQTWIDGRCYFDAQRDQQMRREAAQLREQLVQKALAIKQKAAGESKDSNDDKDKARNAPPKGENDVATSGSGSALQRLLLHGAIHHALEHQGLYHNGADRHNCSTAEW